MNRHNLEYNGLTFHEMQVALINHLKNLSHSETDVLQDVAQELFGRDIYWDEQERKFYRSVEWIRG